MASNKKAAQDFARGQVPNVVCRSLMLATMTALQKNDGGVRGIATGTVFRRLVAKVLARQFSDEVEVACAPLQFALSTRAGTDCVGHAIRVATELNPHLVHRWCRSSRASMLEKLVRSCWPPRFVALREDGFFKRQFVCLG